MTPEPTIAREELVRIVGDLFGTPPLHLGSEEWQRWAAATDTVYVAERGCPSVLPMAIRNHLNLGPEPVVVTVVDTEEGEAG